MPTELLYLHDAYTRSVDTVVRAVEAGDNGVKVTLERTVFYPTGGG